MVESIRSGARIAGARRTPLAHGRGALILAEVPASVIPPADREVMAPSTERRSGLEPRARLAILLFSLLATTGSGAAQDAARTAEAPREEVVVRAARPTDEQITERAQRAIADDRWIYSEHITITTQNGVIRVEGIVQDTWEWFRILDLCRKARGARRVDTSRLELLHNDADGG